MKFKYIRILIFTSISEKTVFVFRARLKMHGKVPFCTYVHRASTFSIVRYDVFAYNAAYLINPTESNEPGSGFYGAFPGTFL